MSQPLLHEKKKVCRSQLALGTHMIPRPQQAFRPRRVQAPPAEDQAVPSSSPTPETAAARTGQNLGNPWLPLPSAKLDPEKTYPCGPMGPTRPSRLPRRSGSDSGEPVWREGPTPPAQPGPASGPGAAALALAGPAKRALAQRVRRGQRRVGLAGAQAGWVPSAPAPTRRRTDRGAHPYPSPRPIPKKCRLPHYCTDPAPKKYRGRHPAAHPRNKKYQKKYPKNIQKVSKKISK